MPRLADRTHSLTNFLWSRKRAVEDADLRKKAVSLEKELWKKAMEKVGGGLLRQVPDMKKHIWLQKAFSGNASNAETKCNVMREPSVCHNYSFGVADIDEQLLEDRIRKKVLSELRRTTYHWTPLKYGIQINK